jgi:hypothetical protein
MSVKDVVASVPPSLPRSGTPERSPAPVGSAPSARRRVLAAAAAAAAVALLFVAYLQVSRTYPENSDESNTLLMAWDMLHGNLLLHGWSLSDVSFYTTELPEYAVLERLFGLHTGTAHIGVAVTYTLVLVLAVLLALGRADQRAASGGPASGGTASGGTASGGTASGSTALPRLLLTAGLMFAPQLGVSVFVLLLSVGHIGTAVPLLLTWLVLDRLGGARTARVRWLVPVLVGLLLTWALIADPLVLIVGVVPLVAVCVIRVAGAVAAEQRKAGREPGGVRTSLRASLRKSGWELSLAGAAILAEALASLVGRLLRASGGFILHPVGYQLAPVHTWPKHAWVTAQGLLALFGAKPEGPAPAMAFALVHLAGLALVAWAMWRVARHFLSWPDMISQILLVAIVANVVLYVPSTLADATDLNAREFAVVLPFAAVLAGRTLAGGLRVRTGQGQGWPGWQKWLAAALLAVYAASLGYAAAQPSVPPANQELAQFLAAHHLTKGIGGYWLSSVVTVGSDGAVTIRAVTPANLEPNMWESKSSWYDPASQRATFLVTDSGTGFFNYWQPKAAALAALGQPARIYRVGPYTIYVWNRNLLPQVASGRG